MKRLFLFLLFAALAQWSFGQVTPVCQNITVYLDGNGQAMITAADIDGGSSTGTGTVNLSASQTMFSCSDPSPASVTLTVDDGAGAMGTCTALVTILDTISPSISCQNITVYLDDMGNASITPADIAGSAAPLFFSGTSGNAIYAASTDGSVTPTILYSNATAASSGPVGIDYIPQTDELIWAGGNNTENWIAPANGSSAPVSLPNADPISGEHHDQEVDFPNARYFFTSNNLGVYVANLDGTGTATLLNANTSGCNAVEYDPATQTVFTNSVNGNAILSMNDDGTGLTTLFDAADGVSGPRGIVLDEAAGVLYWTNRGAGNIMSGNADGSGSTTVVYSGLSGLYQIALDPNTGQLYWTEFGGTDRVVTAPKDGSGTPTILYDGSFGSIRGITLVTGASGPSDNCSLASVSVDISTFSCADVGNPVTVTLTATDAAGNSSTCTSIVTVMDTLAPMVSCEDVTVYLDSSGQATLMPEDLEGSSPKALYFTGTSGNAVYSGSVDGFVMPTVLYANASTSAAGPVGIDYIPQTSELIWAGGNNTENWIAPADGSSSPVSLPNADPVTGEHHDQEVDFANARYFFTSNNEGVYVANLDGTGTATQLNSATSGGNAVEYNPATQTVFTNSIGGNEIVSMNDDGTGLTTLFDSNDGVGGPRGMVLDESTGVLYWTNRGTGTIMSGNADGTGSTTILYDNRSGLYQITLDEETDMLYWTEFGSSDRVISASKDGLGTPDTIYDGSFGSIRGITIGSSINVGGATDNCSIATSTLDISSFSCADVGNPVTVTLTVTDPAGNSANCTSTVTVLDTIAPVAMCQDITVQLDSSGNASIAAADVDAASYDSCGIDTIIIDESAYTCDDLGVDTVTMTVTDMNGNSSTCTALVTVSDTIAPVPATDTLETIREVCEVGTLTSPSATDNCSGQITVTNDASLPITTVGTTVVTWSYDDGNGNVSTQTQDVIIEGLDVSTSIDSITITANNANATAYQWINCADNSPIDGATSASYTATESGQYAVIVTQEACSDTSECADITVVGIYTPQGQQLTLYPNPTQDGQFQIDFTGKIHAVRVLDVAGRVMPVSVTSDGKVDASGLEAGAYLVEVTVGSGAKLVRSILLTN